MAGRPARADHQEHSRRRRQAETGYRSGGIGRPFGVGVAGCIARWFAFAGNVLDDLHALAGLPQAPVAVFRVGHVVAQRRHFVFHGLLKLLRKIFDERKLVGANLQLRNDIRRRGGFRDVEIRAVLEELGGPGGERPHRYRNPHTSEAVAYLLTSPAATITNGWPANQAFQRAS